MSEKDTKFEKKQPTVLDENGKLIKICCACPETRAARDGCLLEFNEIECLSYINAHKVCLRKLGFRI